MTKNKRQLRSEAVERLKMLDVKHASAGDVFGAVLGDYDDNGYNYEGEVAALIDFLRDDEPTNGIDSETNGIHATFPLIGDPPNGDALEIMRSLRGCVNMPMFKDTLCRETTTSNVIAALETLADMVERDYVSRETHIKAADIWQATCDEWEKRCRKLTAERDALAVDLADAMAPHAVDMRVKLDDGAMLPHRAHATDAGADLFAPHDVVIPARGSMTVDTGVHVELPGGTVGMLKSKSGLNVKCNIIGEGTIDEGYGGSIVVKLYNLGDFDVKLPAGSKISQLVVLPVLYPRIVQADEIAAGPRGSNGFGSSDAPLTVVDGNGEVVG